MFIPKRPILICGFAVHVLLGAAGCTSSMTKIDREVDRMLFEATRDINAEVTPAHGDTSRLEIGLGGNPPPSSTAEQPPTINPDASEMLFTEAGHADAMAVMERLEAYSEIEGNATPLDLEGSLAFAVRHSREHRFAEEEFVLTVLRLLSERHLWSPRLFNTLSANVISDADDGFYDTSLALVNDLELTQRLPWGGSVSARLLALATEDLYNRTVGENVQSAEAILSANIPLLRGAGLSAREPRIQAERDVIYGAREFERFRREFMFDIASDYLNLVVLQRQIENARAEVAAFETLEARQKALYDAGRSTPFEWGQAKNETLEAVDRLNSARESYRLSLDRYKARIGVPVDQAVLILPDTLGLPTPRINMDAALITAMSNRLDLQTQRDQIDDSRRGVAVARNGLLGDLDLNASVSIPTDDERRRAGLDFDPDSSRMQVGLTYDFPLDRKIERMNLRTAQIELERSVRSFEQFRDDVAISVRSAVRRIDSALFSLQIQESNVEIAIQRDASIKEDPGRATIQQQTDAINAIARARDARDRAVRDLEVAILGYLLETGQLRVEPDGTIRPLAGLELQALPEKPEAPPIPSAEPLPENAG